MRSPAACSIAWYSGRPATIAGFGDLLKFAVGFFEKAHLAESNSEIVVGLQIFFLGPHFAEFGAKLFKDFLERAGLRGRRWRNRSLWFCSGRHRSARFRVGERGSERIHAQLIDFRCEVR